MAEVCNSTEAFLKEQSTGYIFLNASSSCWTLLAPVSTTYCSWCSSKNRKERGGAGNGRPMTGVFFSECAFNIELDAACRYHVVSQTSYFSDRYVKLRPSRRNTATPDRVHNSPESDQTSRHVNVCLTCCILPPSQHLLLWQHPRLTLTFPDTKTRKQIFGSARR